MSGGGGFRDRGFASRGHYRQGPDGSGGPNAHQNRNDSRTGNSISRSRGSGGTRMGYRGVGARSSLRPDGSGPQSGGSNFRSSRGHPAHRSQMSDNNWSGNNWSNNNGGNNWSSNNGGNNWSDNNAGNNWGNNVWSDNNGVNNWSDNNGGNNWSDNNSARNWAPQGMGPMQGLGPLQNMGPPQGMGPPRCMGPPQGVGPPGGFSPWRSGCAPSRFASPSPFFHPPGPNAFVPYRFLPPMGNNFPPQNHQEYSTTEASPNSQSDVKAPTNAKKPSATQQRIDDPPKPEKPQKQTLHPGSKEERAQKITEAADKLKRTLSTIRKKSESLPEEKEEDNVDFSSRDYDHEPRIRHRGIPELKHDPPELNLTLNDLRDIGRVDHDHATKSSKASKDSTIDDHEVTILEHNPVRQSPKATIDISQDDDDHENDAGDVTQRNETIEAEESLPRDSPKSVDRERRSCGENIEDQRDNTDVEKSGEATNEEENLPEEEIAIDRVEENRQTADTRNQRSEAENVDISCDENLSLENRAMTDNCAEASDNDGLGKTRVTLEDENAGSSIAENSSVSRQSEETGGTGSTKVCAEIAGTPRESEVCSNFSTRESEEAANGEKKTKGESEMSEKASELEKVDVISDENADQAKAKIDCSGKSDISAEVRGNFDEKAKDENEKNDKVDSTDSVSRDEDTNVESLRDSADAKASEEFQDKTIISEPRRNLITQKNDDENSEPVNSGETSHQAGKSSNERSRHDGNREESRSNDNRDEAEIASSALIKVRSTIINDSEESKSRTKLEKKASGSSTPDNEAPKDHGESRPDVPKDTRKSRVRDQEPETPSNDVKFPVRRKPPGRSTRENDKSQDSSSNSGNKRGSADSLPPSTRYNSSKTSKRNKEEIASVKFDPKQPPPNIIGVKDTRTYLPPAFDSRLSSRERSVILGSSMPMNQDFPMSQAYGACTMANMVPSVPTMNYVVPTAVPPPIIASTLEPANGAMSSMCLADPYSALLPLPTIPLVPPLVLSTDIMLQPPLPAELPPPPPLPPTKSTASMEDGLEDMQEAMEFAKQFMDMEEADEKRENRDILEGDMSDEFDIFHMPTFPDLPPIELPPTPSMATADSERPNASDRRSRRSSGFSRSTKNENVTYGPAPKPAEYRDEAEATNDDTSAISDEYPRPKVVFNLSSRSKKIGKQEERHLQNERGDVHGTHSPDFHPAASAISDPEATRNRYKNRLPASLVGCAKEKSAFNGNIDSTAMNLSQIGKKSEKTRSPTPPRRDKCQKLETDKIDLPRTRATKETFVGRSKNNCQTPELAWKNRVIGRFLKMSKNDIRNMLNNASLRKFDIAMKHLVKERRSSMSLEMRSNEEDRMKDAESGYNREEFMDQLSAMLDPSATVDICNLPTQFIHHLSEVLQLDAIPELESRRNETDHVAGVSSSPRTNFASREVAGDSREIVRESDAPRGRRRDTEKQANIAVEGIVPKPPATSAATTEKRKVVADDTSSRAVIGPRPIRRRRLRTAAMSEDRTTQSTNDNPGANDQASLNLADLDDIFSAGIARVKKKLVGVPATKATKNAGASKDSNVDRVERAVVELDEIFSAGIARAKLASKKAAEAAKVAEANDGDVDDDERTWSQGALDLNRSKPRSSVSLRDSCKNDNWNCRKLREEPAAFRNLTKEEWEARHGETSYSSYQREYRALEAFRAQRTSRSPSGGRSDHHPVEAVDAGCPRTRLFENNMGIPSFHECWSGSDEQQSRLRNNSEIVNHQTANSRSSDDSSSTSTTSSSSDGENDDEAPPSVTKLLKVIKEREKIAKQKSVNEEIRDEVTAEIERKRREKDRTRKKHKTRTKKSAGHHRRKRDKKDKSRDRKKRERKRRKRKSRRSNDPSRENSEDADEEYTSSTSRGLRHRRLLTEDEIKKEVVVKEEEPAVARKFVDEKKAGKCSTIVGKTIDDSRPASTASSSSIATTASVAIQTTVVQQPKTKAQLKQMPVDIAIAPVNEQTAKNQPAKVNHDPTLNTTKNIPPATTSEVSNVPGETEKSVDPETTVAEPIISAQPASANSSDLASKVNSKKLDIKAYKERTRQRRQKENEKIRLLTENPGALTRDLLNITLTRKRNNDDEAGDEAAGKSVPVTETRSKEDEKTSETKVDIDSIDSTIVQPASTSISTAKPTKSNVEAKKISPIKAPRKKIVRRPAGTNAATNVEAKSTSEDLPAELSKFAHIKSEGRKEMKLREKLKRERSKMIIADSVDAPSPKPTKLKRRKIAVVLNANETVPLVEEMKNTQVPLSDSLDVAKKAPEVANDSAKSAAENVIHEAKNHDAINTPATIVAETNYFDTPRIIDAGNALSENFDTAETSNVTEGEKTASKNSDNSETSNKTKDERASENIDNRENSNETEGGKVAPENPDIAETSNDPERDKMLAEASDNADAPNEAMGEKMVSDEKLSKTEDGILTSENLNADEKLSETRDEKMVLESLVNAETSNETEDGKLASEILKDAETSKETEDEKIQSGNLPTAEKFNDTKDEKSNDTKDEKTMSDYLNTAETSNEKEDEKIVPENLDSAEVPSEKKLLRVKLNLDDSKVHDIALTLEESMNLETTNISELSITPKVANRSPKRALSSEELPEVPSEDLPSARTRLAEKEKIVETESELVSMELRMEDLPVWSLDVPAITSDIPETLDYSSDGGSFRGFSEETILRRDRVLTEAEITEDSELETFESIPLKFVADDADNTEENIDMDELTSTDIVDNLDVQLPYDNDEFVETRDEIESSLPDPLGHTIFSVGDEIVEGDPVSLESVEKHTDEAKVRDESAECQVEAPITPTLDNSSSIDDFIVDKARHRETVPSPILENELVSSTKIETEVESETKKAERESGTKNGESSKELLTNKSEGETETSQRDTSVVALENDICSVVESSSASKVEENPSAIENASESRINPAEVDAVTLDSEDPKREDESATRMENETLLTPREKSDPELEKVSTASREKPDAEGERKDSQRPRTKDHARSKKKSSRHHNHGSKAGKRTTLTEKMVDDAITANVVKLVARPNSRDTVMARMIEIDVEIHKLMNEKMTLYKMLESGDFADHEGHDTSAADKSTVEAKISAENEETTTEVASKNLLASRLARNLTTPTPTSDTATATRTSAKIPEEAARKPESRKLHAEVEEKQKRRKKSPHRETKNRSRERDIVVEQRDETKHPEAKCNTGRTSVIAGEESSRRETPSRRSREKSTSSTDHDDAEEKRRKTRTKSPIRRASKSRSVHSSKENLVEFPRDSTERAEKSSKIADRSKLPDRTRKRSKHETKKEETARKSKTQDDKLPVTSSVKTGDIYSDESTLDSQVQAETTKSSEDRGKRDKIEAPTGLALLDESFRRDVAHHRKDKSLEKRKRKKRDPTVLTANEAQAGLINLLSRKKLRKKSASSITRDKSKSLVSSIEDPVKVWKHVSTVIDAVAKNRVEELYTEEKRDSSSVLEASSIDERANGSEIHRGEEETSPEESTSKGDSRLHDKSETVKTAGCEGFVLTEASDTVEAILRQEPRIDPSNLEDVENPRVSPEPDIPKTPDIDNDRAIKTDEDTSDEEITRNKESFDGTRTVRSSKEREKYEEIRAPAQERSASTEKPKPWRIDFTEKKMETKEANVPKANHLDTGAKTSEEMPSREEKCVEETLEERQKIAKTPFDDDDEIPRSRSRNSRRTKRKSRSETGKDAKKEKHESIDDNRHNDDEKTSRRPRSATNRRQREKSDKSHRRSSRKSEDRGSKSSRSRKREHDRSNSRGISPHDDEPSKKRSSHRQRSSSPPLNPSALDDRSKKVRGKKRKRRAEMSLEEMTSCKVELIDCKYTYLSPTMHPRILKKLGISRINRHAVPKMNLENPSPPLSTRNAATPSPPILSKIDVDEAPINEDDRQQLQNVEISPAEEENVPKITEDKEDEEAKEENSIRSPAECLIVKENVDDDDDDEGEDDEDDDNIQIVKAVDENSPNVEHGHEDNEIVVKRIVRPSFDETDNEKNRGTETEMITVEEDDDNVEEYEVIDEVTDENEDTDENERSKNDTENHDDKIAVPADTPEASVEREETLATEENDNETEPRRTRYTVHKGPILDIKVLDDSFLAASEDGAIYRYSQTSNGILNIYKGHDAAVTCINVLETPGRRWNLYSGSLDGTFRSYDITTGVQDRPANVGSPVQCMDQGWGIIFIGTKSGHISRYNIKSGSLKGDRLEFSDKSVLALKASAEGPRRVLIVASRNQPITIRDANTGLFLRTICGYKNHTVYSLMRDRNLVYCGTSSTSIPVYDFTNGEQITQYNAGVGIVCMRLYRQILFAGCYDGNIYVFDTKESKLICSIPGPGNMLLSMEVINDEIIAGSKNRQLHLWRMPKQVRALLAERT